MSKKMVLIDGHSILNRAFYGVPELTNSQGLHTNAVYGFLNIMFKIIDEEQPDYLTVAFDVHAPTFRHEIYKEYKGTRKGMPDELREQVPVMKEMLKAMDICIMEKAGLEADDILGTIAKRSEREGMEVSLVSGDRDLLQIASDHIKIRIPKTKGGKTEIEDYYAKDVETAYGVNPIQFIDLKALMGDTADNIPGVPKVGTKTATELMMQFGSLENIYEHVEEITKKAIKQSLIENKDLADLSKVLATINIDADIDYSFDMAEISNFYTPDAYVMCKQLEFKNLLSRFEKDSIAVNHEIDYFKTYSDFNEVNELFSKINNGLAEDTVQIGIGILCDKDTDKKNSKTEKRMIGVSVAYDDENVAFIPCEGFCTEEYLRDQVSMLVNSAESRVALFDVKKQYDYLTSKNAEDYFDVLIAAYLINPLKNDYQIEDIANEYLGLSIPDRNQVCEKKSYQQTLDEKPEEFRNYACFIAYVCRKTMTLLQDKLQEQKMWNLFTEIEMPLTTVLYDMERYGIKAKEELLKEYSTELGDKINDLESDIYKDAGCEFNINSPKQLGEILFEKLGLPGGKKTKTGYSTAADVLEKLAVEHSIVANILEYRGLAKLKSTYADGLVEYIGEDNRIHSTFNQTITATGRISSTEPNLQNIPMRTEMGRRMRKVFIPEDGYVFMDADYSQIELRILAHIANDKQLIEAYQMDEDIHRITASKVFHTPFEEVTDLQRRNAKAVNFGIVYGISSFGLSQDLSISKKEAQEYIEQYFETYPDIKKFLDNIVHEAKENGYVTTLYGRRRPIPELSSSNFMQRSFGERVAMNSPIQGTAADIMKIAMIHVYKRLKEENLKSRLILQIHDELLIETCNDEVDRVRALLTEEMQNAAKLAVALEIDLHTGTDWYEAK